MKKHLPIYLSICTLILILQGCLMRESDYDKRIREDDEAIETYLAENNIETEKASSGVHIEIISEKDQGRQVQEDHVVGIIYTMRRLGEEDVIESHSDTLQPLKFSHSSDALIPAGLNYEIGRMREGEKFRFYIPSYQAFGEYSHNGLFPPNSNFIIEVELKDLKTEDEIYEQELDSIKSYIERNNIDAEAYPNGLYYVEVEEGAQQSPEDNDLIRFHFTRKYLDGTVIETTEGDDPVEVYLNEDNLVRGLGEGLKLMKESGKAELIMPSKIAVGKSRQVIPQKVREDWVDNDEIKPRILRVKPFSSVIYAVELLEVY